VAHKEDDRQRLKQLDVALQTMATQTTRKLRLAAEKFGKALPWFERGATAGKLTANVQLDSALKEKKKLEKQKIELLKAQISIRVHGYGWARFKTAWSSSTDKTVGTVADLTRRVKQMFADEKAEKLRPPSEPPVPDAATKRLETLGTLTIQASSLLAKRQARTEVIREVAAQLQADKAAAAEATEVARHDACALRQPDEPPAVEMGSHLKVLVLIEEPEEDGSILKEYGQWVAVVVVAATDGTAAHKKPTATGQVRKVNIGRFLVRYKDDGVEE